MLNYCHLKTGEVIGDCVNLNVIFLLNFNAIYNQLQDEETTLQKLNLSDCKLKTDLNNVINALGSNQCIQVNQLVNDLMIGPTGWHRVITHEGSSCQRQLEYYNLLNINLASRNIENKWQGFKSRLKKY